MTRTLTLCNENATVALAQQVATFVQKGDVVRLEGDLGAGKSTFARAFIRALGTQSAYIPSPTFTLMQMYDDTRLPVAHLDCYRLEDPAELDYLGLEEVYSQGVMIVEWPLEGFKHRLADAGTLTLALTPQGETVRQAIITAEGSWVDRLPLLEG